MNKFGALLYGMGLGAGMMYFYDPEQGRRRRALLRDKTTRLLNDAGREIDVTTRDLNYRAQGLLAELRGRVQQETLTDTTLIARVRAHLGHIVTNAGAVNVAADNGRVILSGFILASDREGLLRHVSAVRGVKSVEDRLTPRNAEPDVAHLRPRAASASALDRNWSPNARLALSLVGSLLAAYGARKRGLLGTALGPVGIGLLARGLNHTDVKGLLAGEDAMRVISRR